MPNLKYYWIAAQLRAMTVWLSDDKNTRWLNMEKNCSINVSLSVIPFHGQNQLENFQGNGQGSHMGLGEMYNKYLSCQ